MMPTLHARVVRGTEMDTMGVIVPDAVVEALGKGKRPPVVVTVGGHTWRSTVARMGGQYLLGIAKEHRAPAQLTGDEVEIEITLELDIQPRTVPLPDDLAAALAEAGLRDAFDELAPSHRKEWVRSIEEAKLEATRARRVDKCVAAVRQRD